MFNWQTILGLAISLACLAFVLREVDLAQLWTLILDLNPLYVVGINLLLFVSFLARAARWRVLLCPVRDCAFWPLFSANLIGFMANNVLPARLGEFVRALAANRVAGVAASSALATIVVERILDGMTLLAILFLTLLFADPARSAGAFSVAYMHAAGLALLAGYLAVLAGIWALWRWPAAFTRLVTGVAGRISPRLAALAANILATFAEGLAVLGQARRLPLLIAQSLMVWLPMLAMFVVFLPAVGLPLSLFWGAMAFVGASLASAVPAGPGYVGTFQLAVLWALVIAGAPSQPAAVFGLLFWAAEYFPLTIAGLVEMWRHGLSLGKLSRAQAPGGQGHLQG
ncbi:MAG: lysylphosphatidylglycerol synthase transmembrane domain-containing protein [Thermodesulfobacteriota bacterium]